MDKRKIAEEKQRLLNINYTETYSKRVRKKAMAINMYLNDITPLSISKILCISDRSVYKYIELYREKGVLGLLQENPNRPISELELYSDEIIETLKKEPCSTINECSEKIENLTGIKRSPTQVAKFLKKKNFKRLKTAQIPSKADPEKQKDFLEKELEPRLEEAKSGKSKVLFVDAAHFVMGAYLAYLWCLTRVFIKSSSGRQRYNVLGAIDPFSHELTTVTNHTYINSDSICELLLKIHNKYVILGVPITIVLDNARYQRCNKVTERAKELGIELLFLPTYSPNLNLIERLWKFVKKKCLYAKHYETFADFKTSINECLSKIETEYKTEISRLITTNFQLFKDIKEHSSMEKAA